MSAGGEGLIDWRVAEQTAGVVGGGLGGLGGGGSEPRDPYSRDELSAAVAAALGDAADYAMLGGVSPGIEPELIDRREWARSSLATLAAAAAPLETRMAGELSLPGPLGGLARRLVGTAVGAEAGLAVGYASRRVLGQYDVSLFGAERPPRLLFLGENLDRARAEMDADRALFLRWIALHESTHVIQFRRVEWLAPRIRGLAAELIEGAARGPASTEIGRLVRELVRTPREVVRSLLRGEAARVLADSAQRRLLDELQALMSVIEGHAEHVMDACLGDSAGALADLRAKLTRRRANRSGLGEVIGRLLGIEAKLRQYERGKEFVDAIAAAAGPQALTCLWEAPEMLPTLGELERPEEWLGRTGLGSSRESAAGSAATAR